MTERDEASTPTRVGLSEGLGAWVQSAENLPDYDLPVWLYENGIVYVGCRIFDSEGWLWAKCYQMPYVDNEGTWKLVDAEADDDYQPTLWQPLPEVPRYTQAELDAAAAEARGLVAGIRVE